MGKKKKRRRRRIKPASVILTVLVVLLLAVGIVLIVNRFSSNRTVTDLEAYYNLTEDESEGRAAASDDELAIVLDCEILSERAVVKNGHIYIEREFLRDNIDERLYYDSNEDILIMTNAVSMTTSALGSCSYETDGTETNLDHPVTFKDGDKVYVSLDFISELTCASYEVYEEPDRVVITTASGKVNACETERETQIRVRGGRKSEIVAIVEEGTKLTVLEDLDDWLEVCSEDGYLGYVAASAVSDVYTETVENDFTEPEYTSISLGEEIKLGWGGIYTYAGNERYEEFTANVGDMNVYSPTWYYLADGTGGLTSYSAAEYVSQAHEDGYQVWPLISDVDSSYISEVLNNTSYRWALIDNIMADIAECGADGINVDFEGITSECSEGFVQFLREFSIRCRNEGVILSVDNYAPYSYNASVYHTEEQGRLCDYVIIMAYDDYVGTEEIGANSSLPFIEEIMDLAAGYVDSEKLVAALPFYSRFWYEEADGTYSRVEYGLDEAWEELATNGAEAVWNSNLGVYCAEYTADGQTVYCWLENEETFEAKFELLQNYDLAGYAFWQLGRENKGVWEVIDSY